MGHALDGNGYSYGTVHWYSVVPSWWYRQGTVQTDVLSEHCTRTSTERMSCSCRIRTVPSRLESYGYSYKLRELIAAMLVNPADRYGEGIKSPSDIVSH